MAQDLIMAEPSLRQVLEMDADKTSALATIPLMQDLVPLFKKAGTKAEVGLAALVCSLATVKVVTLDGEVKAKWEVCPLVRDENGEWLPGAPTWADFCLVHLGLDPSTASRYKRIWQVFAGDLGFDHNDLARAGICNLRLALGTVARMYPTIDMPLITALFGAEHCCANCGSEQSPDVPFCQACGEKFEPTPEGGAAAVLLRLKQLKGTPDTTEGVSVLPDVQPMLQDGKVTGWVISPQVWIEGEEGVSYLASWEVEIISDDAPKDAIGLRHRHAEGFRQWLMKHLG